MRSDTRSDPVSSTREIEKLSVGFVRQSPQSQIHEKKPYKSPSIGPVQPRSIRVEAPHKGDSNRESVEKHESDGDLKFMRRKYNLNIDTDTGEGQEILDPEIKIPEESDFYEPEPLEQVVDVKKQWYRFLPKQGDVDKILTQINHKILSYKTALDAERLKSSIPN